MKTQLSGFKSAVAALLILAGATACKKNANTPGGEVSSTIRRAVTDSLIFSDDFNGGTLDATKWSIVEGNEEVNHEMQTYVSSAVKSGDSTLQLEANLQSLNGRLFTSGKITTKNKFQLKYGRIEARIKLPVADGLAASFMLSGVDAGVAQNGQIDIVQHVNKETKIDGGIRWDNGGGANYVGNTVTTPAEFHIYAVEWDEKEVRWYIDGKQYHTANIENNVNSTEEFHKPFFIDLKLAVGGDLTGPVQIGTLPENITVDYIKVYKQTVQTPAPPIGRSVTFYSPGKGFISAGTDIMAPLTIKPLGQDSLAVFTVLDAGNGKVALKSFHNNVSSENGDIPLSCNKEWVDAWEKFDWIENSNGTISLRGNNQKYVTVTAAGTITCTADSPTGAAQFL